MQSGQYIRTSYNNCNAAIICDLSPLIFGYPYLSRPDTKNWGTVLEVLVSLSILSILDCISKTVLMAKNGFFRAF